jgi:hypothetical protein
MYEVLVVLFILLSPGVLFTIPSPGRNLFKGGNYTSFKVVIVHAIIFYLIASLNYSEAFLTQQQIDAQTAVTSAQTALSAAQTALATANANLTATNTASLSTIPSIAQAPAPAPARAPAPSPLLSTSSAVRRI